MIDGSQLKKMTAVEQRLYGYLLANQQEVKYMRIRELAQASGVSATTIVRFSKKVGCEGFAEFRLELQQRQKQVDNHERVSYSRNVEKFLGRVKGKEYQQKIVEALTIISQARIIVFFGGGQSALLAEYGAQLVGKKRPMSFFATEVFQLGPAQRTDELVAIVISASGENEKVIQQLKAFKQNNHQVISITNTQHNTLAQLSDVTIAYYTESVSVIDEQRHSQVPVLYIIEELAGSL
ncbi:MurR/RpiR family transcriptional regulator [Brochothrix campestris]|uniref:Putative transcriptional regulator n=1 Tax=Brochothrix campestris FSL F6-1037 TaxID=1265861 RepID=W7CGS8_9LIST|nr:MurR/RpiR family transcriptional regulator [Brochothrix campestris]EUJ38624.1 putative transcriptional regulator [Brochothrix campestris FSL F6-1037]